MMDRPTRTTDTWSYKLRVAKYILGFLLVVMLVGIVLVQFVTLTNVQNIAEDTNQSTERLLNTDARYDTAVKTINDSQKAVVTIAAYCSKQPGNNTLVQIEDCVNKELGR